jgi:biotin carboxylase
MVSRVSGDPNDSARRADIDSGEPGHVLILGDPGDIPPLFQRYGGDLVMSCILDAASYDFLHAVRHFQSVSVVPVGAPLDHWVALARAAHEITPVTKVVAFVDRYLRCAAAVGRLLGVPAPSEELVRLVHHKPSMRQRLYSACVEQVPYTIARHADDVVAFGEEFGWPVVVKPARGTGSVGVIVLENADQVRQAFLNAVRPTRFSGDGVLVEQYLDGEQVSVDAFSEGGDHEVLAITKSYSDYPHGTVLGLALPTVFGQTQTVAIHHHIRATLTALGVRDGPTFTQLALTPDGPRVIESHLRLPGDETTAMFQDVSGVEIATLWVKQLLGQRVLPELRTRSRGGFRGACAVWLASPDIEGTLLCIEGIDEAAAMPGVVHVERLLAPGDRVHPLRTNWDRGVLIRSRHQEADLAVAAARAAAERIVFVVNTGLAEVRTAYQPKEIL